MMLRRLFVALAACALSLAACRKAQITSYRAPKEKDAEMPAASATAPTPGGTTMADTPVATAPGAALTWTAPAHWQAKTGSAMRKGSYAVPGEGGADADLAITAFPGDVGGELANLNRWRGQLQLPPVGEAELAAAVTRVEHHGLKFGVVDIAGTGATAQRILGAWVPVGGATWFVKLTGPDARVAQEKPAFFQFLSTVKPAAGSTP